MSERFRGIFSIAYTPFDREGNLLFDDFASVCDWVARSGAHGLVWPVMASEYTVISYPERVRGVKIAVGTVAGEDRREIPGHGPGDDQVGNGRNIRHGLRV